MARRRSGFLPAIPGEATRHRTATSTGGESGTVRGDIRSGRLDAGFVNFMPESDPELDQLLVARQHVELAAPKGHPLTRLRYCALAALGIAHHRTGAVIDLRLLASRGDDHDAGFGRLCRKRRGESSGQLDCIQICGRVPSNGSNVFAIHEPQRRPKTQPSDNTRVIWSSAAAVRGTWAPVLWVSSPASISVSWARMCRW
jgi:hypothetical protein